MSLAGLVAYESSDESEDEVMSADSAEKRSNPVEKFAKNEIPKLTDVTKIDQPSSGCSNSTEELKSSSSNLHLETLPPPQSRTIISEIEEDSTPVPIIKKIIPEKPPKKVKGPVEITIPSLSKFADLEDESPRVKTHRPAVSKKSASILKLLPPPKTEGKLAVIPDVLKKPPSLVPRQLKTKSSPVIPKKPAEKLPVDDPDEDEITTGDFFALSAPKELPISAETMEQLKIPAPTTIQAPETPEEVGPTTTVLNLRREEILLKNKAEVGPKLPVPEQEFNVDAEGNVAFDDKAIEYLCGRRGVKRKEKLMTEADLIDINGEDMKPDEREWLVKALTEEPVQRPVSIGSGPSSQSKKKHQITYLAHQAKAMEIELKNQWAANRLARQQTRAKYGF